MRTEILIVAEHNGTELDPITLDLIAWGAQVGAAKNWKTGLLVAGSQLGPVLASMSGLAVDAVYLLDDPGLEPYNAGVFVAAMGSMLQKSSPQLVLLGHTYLGIEMSGGLAAKLNATLWCNCQSIEATDNGYKVTRPIARGAFISTLEIQANTQTLVTIQRGASPAKDTLPRSPEAVRIAVPVEMPALKLKVMSETKAAFAADITKADILVAVGRGIGGESQLPAYQNLAQALGGSIAVSRPLVDMGWISADYQVGLSGRTVKPKVYLACGISGSMQHLAGMKNSKLIIAINEDANAPIFQYAHYGVVADLNAILPALTSAAKPSAGARA